MQRTRFDKKKIMLSVTAIASMLVLAIVVAKIVSYSYDMYRSGKKVEELREKIGEATLVLDTDVETGRSHIVPHRRKRSVNPRSSERSVTSIKNFTNSTTILRAGSVSVIPE